METSLGLGITLPVVFPLCSASLEMSMVRQMRHNSKNITTTIYNAIAGGKMSCMASKMESDYYLLEKDIDEPLENDVVFACAPSHPGNARFQQMIDEHKAEWQNGTLADRHRVCRGLLVKWRGLSPPGRFLKRNRATGKWYGVGDMVARASIIQKLCRRRLGTRN